MYVLEGGLAGPPTTLRLVSLGAQVNGLVLQGQWWRIVTAMFLHLSWLHILLNGWSLWVMGQIVEPVLGARDYLVVYLLGGVMGGLVSLVAYAPNVLLAGASGAIFGLLGATLVIAWNTRGPLRGTLLRWVVSILVLNIGFDFMVPGIGVYDHLGGLVGGLLATYMVSRFGMRNRLRYVSAGAYVAMSALLVDLAQRLWG